MAGGVGQVGYCNYVLFGKDGLPLAVIEAKRTSKDPNIGRKQAVLYADCLERKFGRRPMMFTTNGFETYYWDDQSGPQRKVSGVFSKEDLQKLMNRRAERQDLMSIPIDDKITDRYYQKEAIRAVCAQLEQGFRKHLLVMATGTGKTWTEIYSAKELLKKKNAVVVICAPYKHLVKQWAEDVEKAFPTSSIILVSSENPSWEKQISNAIIRNKYDAKKQIHIISTISPFEKERFRNTINKSLDETLLIVDEAHRFTNRTNILKETYKYMLGLRAEPDSGSTA